MLNNCELQIFFKAKNYNLTHASDERVNNSFGLILNYNSVLPRKAEH